MLALLSIAGMAAAAWLSVPALVAACLLSLAILLALVGLHTPMAVRMARRAQDRRMLLFVLAGVLRDVARALGMVWGIWAFMIRRKATA